MTLDQQIGRRLRVARKACGYKSARAFATKFNIPESTYSQHETGKRSLSPELLLFYSERLGINPGWLVTGPDDAVKAAMLNVISMPAQQTISDIGLFKQVYTQTIPHYLDNTHRRAALSLLEHSILAYQDALNVMANSKREGQKAF